MFPQFLASHPPSPNQNFSLLLIYALTNLTLQSKTWWSERPRPIPLTILTFLSLCTKRHTSFFPSKGSFMPFTSILSWPLVTLVYLCKLLCLKYVLPTETPFQPTTLPFFFHYHFLPRNSKSTGYTGSHPITSPSVQISQHS